jgi:flagellar assembly protein FliH
MQQNFAIKLDKKIKNARLMNDSGGSAGSAAGANQDNAERDTFIEELQSQTAQITQIQANFTAIVENLAHLQSEFFNQQKEQIARLSVEVARKVLAGKVEQRDYAIEEIIKQAIDDAPVSEDIVVRLNPDDYATIEQLIKTPDIKIVKGVSFVADSKIKPAECVLETPKGIIESFIEQKLDKITELLKTAG